VNSNAVKNDLNFNNMNDRYKKIKDLLYKFEKYGVKRLENGAVLIGHPDYLSEHRWINEIYAPLNEHDIEVLEKECNTSIPDDYKFFLKNFANGINVLSDCFSLDGLRKELGRTKDASRQPYALKIPNVMERFLVGNTKESYFFIGGYSFDGSLVYIDKETDKVHFCKDYDATPLYTWNSLEDMLFSEITRIYTLFTEDGRKIDENRSTLPI